MEGLYVWIKKRKNTTTNCINTDDELTDEELGNISNLGAADFARYLTEEESMQIIKCAKNSTKSLRMMEAMAADIKRQEEFTIKYNKGRNR